MCIDALALRRVSWRLLFYTSTKAGSSLCSTCTHFLVSSYRDRSPQYQQSLNSRSAATLPPQLSVFSQHICLFLWVSVCLFLYISLSFSVCIFACMCVYQSLSLTPSVVLHLTWCLLSTPISSVVLACQHVCPPLIRSLYIFVFLSFSSIWNMKVYV